jgi:hypothetical protein
MHIVHAVDSTTLPGCGNSSCLAVLGLLFEYGEEANPFIEAIFSNMPIVEKVRGEGLLRVLAEEVRTCSL